MIVNIFYNMLALCGLISLFFFIGFYIAELSLKMTKTRKIIAIPPGATIKEQLGIIGMSKREFATRMDMSEEEINILMNGNIHITPVLAKKLEEVLGIPGEFWNNLETIYQSKIERVKKDSKM